MSDFDNPPKFGLMLDVAAAEEDNLGEPVRLELDKKPRTSKRDEKSRSMEAMNKGAGAKPKEPYAHGNIKANRTRGDENGRHIDSPLSRASMKRKTADSEISDPHSLDHGTSTSNQKFWHITDKTQLLDILRKHSVLVVSEIPPDLMAEISQVSHVYVLQSSEEARLKDPDEWQHALGVFLSLVDQPMVSSSKDQWMFIFVDPSLDAQAHGPDIDWTTLQHYQYGEVVCENMLGVTKAAMPTARSVMAPQPAEKAKKRGSVLLPCPLAEKRRCCATGEMQHWKCEKCGQEFEYGFDGQFYCDCGKFPADSFVFHCGKPKHGREHVGLQDVGAALKHIRPFKEINILVLGETGVGKSTWINGFGNFLTYATLDEALQEPIYLIPAQFNTMDSDFNETVVSMGSSDNEATQTGESATQMPKTYTFKKGNVLVRLIDTPGIGDTRGTEQDKKNFVNIMQHLSGYENLHGICILLKPNNARLTVMFQFCVKELLTHLHRDACHNIVFVFTNARATFYRPGDSFPTLKELIKNSKGVHIPLIKDTVYCVDNEAVRFMAALKAGVKFDQTERENFVKSWEKSVEETTRLLQHISTRSPHALQNTLSLNEARRMILSFTEPLTHITKNIQINVKLADDKAEEITAVKCSRDELRCRLSMPVMDLEMVQLNYPRTVCTAQSCIRLVGRKVNYVTWCHEHCRLNGIVPNQYPQPGLRSCEAMKASGGRTCSNCRCRWEKHMHITYELREIEIDHVDQSIEDLMRHKDGEIAAVERFMVELEQRKLDLLAEEDRIRKVSAKFGYFLKKNAMLPYNDAMEGYLRHLISAEEEKVAIGASRDCLRNYEKMLAAYCEEKRILEEAMQHADDEHQITANDVKQAMESLFNLPIYGQTIRDMVNVMQNAHGQQMRHSEILYAPKPSARTIWRRNGVQSLLDMIGLGFGNRSRDDRYNTGQHPTEMFGRGWNSGRHLQFAPNRWVQQNEQRQPPWMPSYGNNGRLGRMPEHGDYGCMGDSSGQGNYKRVERVSDSRSTGPQYDRLPMMPEPSGSGDYRHQSSSRSSSIPRDVSAGMGMGERVYQQLQHWMK